MAEQKLETLFHPWLSYWFGMSSADSLELEQYELWRSVGAIHVPGWLPDSAREEDMRSRFGELLDRLAMNELEEWRSGPEGCLAYVMVADLLPRCLGRGTSDAYVLETFALDALDRALAEGWDKVMDPLKRAFFYMPLTHAESLDRQRESRRLYSELLRTFRAPGRLGVGEKDVAAVLGAFAESAFRHFRIVRRFGRFPNRNAALERVSTMEEASYLKDPWSFFTDDENAP